MPQEKISRVCSVCGAPITRFLYPERLRRKWIWHNFECFKAKPIKVLELEEAFGKSIKEILLETAQKFGTLEAQCDALQVSVPYLYSLHHKFFGVSLPEFMRQYATGHRKSGYLERGKSRRDVRETVCADDSTWSDDVVEDPGVSDDGRGADVLDAGIGKAT